MVKIRWIITDDIENVDLKEFDTEWNGIYGYFELCINNQVVGYCPNRELLVGEEADEDILYWLSELSDGIIRLNDSQEYEIHLLCMSLAKIVLKKNDKFVMDFVNSNTDEIIWSEEVGIQELCNEVLCNIGKFIAEVQTCNLDLLESKLIKKLIKVKDTLLNKRNRCS